MVQDPWLPGTSVRQSLSPTHPFLPSSNSTHTSKIKTVVRVAEHNNTTPSPDETGKIIYLFFCIIIIANNMTSSLVLVSNLICIYIYMCVPPKFSPGPKLSYYCCSRGSKNRPKKGGGGVEPSMPDIDVCRATMQLHYLKEGSYRLA